MEPLKIIIIDDNDSFRKALKMLMTTCFNATIIGEASSADEFLNTIKYTSQADIIFMDIMMPEIDGIKLTKKLLWHNHKLKIVAISLHNDSIYLKSLVEAGFMGCVFKNELFRDMEKAIKTVMSGKRFFPDNIIFDKN